MIPKTDNILIGIDDNTVEVTRPIKTYRLDVDNYRIQGRYIEDELEAVKQAAYLILSTERFKHVIYSDYYGCEIKSLIGKPEPIIETERKRMIAEALTEHDLIDDVVDFKIDRNKDGRLLSYKLITPYGEIDMQTEVIG